MNDPRRLILWCWCRQCGQRERLELPPTVSEGELDELSGSFICDGCRRGRADIAAGKIVPQSPPEQRRDGPDAGTDILAAIHDAADMANPPEGKVTRILKTVRPRPQGRTAAQFHE